MHVLSIVWGWELVFQKKKGTPNTVFLTSKIIGALYNIRCSFFFFFFLKN